MKRGFWAFWLVLVVICASHVEDGGVDPGVGTGDPAGSVERLDVTPLDVLDTRSPELPGLRPCFIENRGQLDDGEVAYYAPGGSVSVGFGPGWAAYAVREADGQHVTVFRTTFAGCEPVTPTARDPEAHPTSYFIGPDESEWVVGARSYRTVLYQDLYEGIDVAYYFEDGCLKYDVVVGPGSDPAAYRLEYEGVATLEVDGRSGDLLVGAGGQVLTEAAPRAFQVMDGRRVEVEAAFQLGDGGTLGFAVGDHDPSIPLVIDPGLAFSTYLGGTKEDYLNDMAVDEGGHMLLTGYTWGSGFPTKVGSYDTSYGSYQDAFAVKLARDGRSLEYATFLGGGGNDQGEGICVDTSGCAYVVGGTGGTGYPTTAGAYDRTIDGGEAFVTKLKADGTGLVYSTYLGGTKNEWGYGVCLDDDGNAYIHGETTSNADLPVTSGCYDANYNGGDTDAFLAKLDATGASLLYMTYLGGSGKEYPGEVGLDGSGDVYLMGHTLSTDFPTTASAFDRSHGGRTDIYVTKMNISSSSLAYSTFVGWMGVENGVDLFIDGSGCAYVPGLTDSLGFPTTPGAYQRTRGGWYDAFCFKLEADGSDLAFSTFLGGTEWDQANGVWVNANGTVYVAGNTGSSGFPVTQGAYCTTYDDGTDAFLTLLSKDGSRVLYSTFMGGEMWDRAQRVVATDDGAVFVAGHTISTDFPTTIGAFDTTHAGQRDLFALVMDLIPPVLVAETIDPFATTGDPFGMDLDVTDNFGVKRVEVEHWQGTSPGHAWVNMTLVSGTEEAGTWNVTLLARSDTLEDLNLRVHAWDLADNKMDVISYVRSVRDNDPPAFVEDHSPDSAETDMSYTFNVSVEDNIGLQDVWIEYWYGDGNRTGATMELRGSTWEAVIIVGDTLDDLHYYLWCRDTSDNRNSTSVRTVPVIDINGPQIVNEGTGRTATTGDPFEFTLTAWDNVGLKGATLWYAYGDDELVPVDMMVEEAGPSGNVLYSLIIDVRSDFVGNITYRIGLEDLYGNNFTTFDKYVRVVDDDPPMVLDEDISPSATTGDPFSYRLTVTDNIGIASVQLDYFFSDDPPNATISTEAMVMEGLDGNGNEVYSLTIEVPSDSIETLWYVYTVNDVSGGHLSSDSRKVAVIDDDSPTFGEDLSDSEALRNHIFHFDVEYGDNIGVVELRCEWWFGEGEHLNETVPLDTRIAIDVPPHPEGALRYLFSARDAAGNWNSTEVFERPIPNRPPVLVAPELWEVGEEVDGELDMEDSIEDPDGPWDAMVLGCGNPNVTVSGLILQLRHDIWVPDYVIQVWVTDGESTAWANITVRVVPVNDVPVIDQILWNGRSLDPAVEVLSFKRGGGDDLLVRATDEDGDELSYRWLREGQVVATGDTVRADDLPLGSYILTVEVDDGTEAVSADLAVLVTEEEEEDTADWWVWVLLIVIIIALAAVGFIYWRGRDQT